MSIVTTVDPMDTGDVDYRHVAWCDKDSTNDGTTSDTGKLQGATISTSAWTLDTGLAESSENTNSVTIDGITYDANTVATILIDVDSDASGILLAKNTITTSDGRTLNHTLAIPII